MAEVVANGFVLLVAIVGHLLIVRAVINRGYELGLPQRVWQTLVTLLILIAVAGSIVIVRNAGLRGAMLIRGGAWSGLSSGWMIYLGVCITAFVVGVIVLVLRSRDSRVPAQISSKSDVLDYTQVASAATQANGAVGTLARLPGNQIFTVEIVQREVRLPRLPPQWDGLSILHITDLHMNGTPHRGFFEWAADRCAELNCDIATMTGDVMDTLEVIEWLPTTLGKLSSPLGNYFVLGNHDLHAGGEAMRAAMERMGWTSVAGRVVSKDFRDARLLIGGTESPWAGEHPPMEAAPAADDAVRAANDFRLLLSHAPHLIRWARQRRIDLLLAGHLHGGQIQWPIIGPIAGGRFHSGLFDLPPTLMHVGRGLGQMAPIRWGCRPEITKLVLRHEQHKH
jgi:predicted MPP superfamily phosphohydrolase